MAITTYAELQAAAANWLVRGDLTARIPEFIALAEARLSRTLRLRQTEADAALTATVGSRIVALPAGFGEALELWLEGADGRARLRFLPAELMGASSLRGPPGTWTVDGANLAFDRPCDQAYALTLRMVRRLALSDAAPTNAVLAEHPDVYLFATLCEAAPFLRDAEMQAAYEGRLAQAMEAANAQAARNRRARTLALEPARLVGAGRC